MRPGSDGSIDDTAVERKIFGAAEQNLLKLLKYLIKNLFEHVKVNHAKLLADLQVLSLVELSSHIDNTATKA